MYKLGIERIKDYYVKEVLKTGVLTKKGHKVKSMKERYFVLTPQSMSYSEGKNSSKTKGSIFIAKVFLF